MISVNLIKHGTTATRLVPVKNIAQSVIAEVLIYLFKVFCVLKQLRYYTSIYHNGQFASHLHSSFAIHFFFFYFSCVFFPLILMMIIIIVFFFLCCCWLLSLPVFASFAEHTKRPKRRHTSTLEELHKVKRTGCEVHKIQKNKKRNETEQNTTKPNKYIELCGRDVSERKRQRECVSSSTKSSSSSSFY